VPVAVNTSLHSTAWTGALSVSCLAVPTKLTYIVEIRPVQAPGLKE